VDNFKQLADVMLPAKIAITGPGVREVSRHRRSLRPAVER
jgi:hypothetical protein